tara:strand:- start:1122 stop:1253 length:132 start_codon:yes stop_codon:yes gene_type:complete
MEDGRVLDIFDIKGRKKERSGKSEHSEKETTKRTRTQEKHVAE